MGKIDTKLIKAENVWLQTFVCDNVEELRAVIEQTPAVDAVEVLRCKNCRFSVQDNPCDPMECMKWKSKRGLSYTTPDGYCHKGERK